MTTTVASPHAALSKAIAGSARVLTGADDDYDGLLDLIGDARFVLLGEATHGTREFYRERARITQRLIAEKEFTAIAVEADWPDACRVNRYVRSKHDAGDASASLDATAGQALGGFKRFPTWMWRNAEVVDFVDWLRSYNDSLLPSIPSVGFYGLDLYSLFTSIREVLSYLARVDPEAAQRARARYACFDHFNADSQRYGYAAAFNLSDSCERAVVAQLRDLQAHAADYLRHNGMAAVDALFYAEQNSRLIVNAEAYYRTMFHGRISSWNLRDRHMTETLSALDQHLARRSGAPSKIVVWEHNSHIGDARATDVGQLGEWNVGQLTREMAGNAAFLLGFTTYHGSVTAASDWDAPAERKQLMPALPGSYEEVFHDTHLPRFLLSLRDKNRVTQGLSDRRLERAVGVIYAPHTERQSHYFYAHLPQQFDAVVHIDATSAVRPLEFGSHWSTGDAPETYPLGL